MTPRHARWQQRQRLPRPVAIAMSVVTLAVAGAAPAWAFLSATASTSAAAGAGTLNPPATVSATATSATSITVTVTAAPASGLTPSSYKVVRNGTTTVCSSVALNTGCVDSGLSSSTSYTYAVTSQLGTWSSAATASASATTLAGPAVPTVGLTAATDTGALGDGYTTSTTPSFTGTATSGSVVTLIVDGVAVTPTAAASGGTWTITPASPPSANASHTIKARATLNGATSADSAGFGLLIDTVKPVNGSASAACTVLPVNNNYCRGNATVTVTGISDASPSSGLGTLAYSVAGGGASGTAPISSGSASFTYTPAEGAATAVTYTPSDVAGNAATSSNVTPGFGFDRTAPVATSLVLSNVSGGTLGQAEKGDFVSIGYSDATSGLNPASLCSTWTPPTGTSQSITANGVVTVTITEAGANDTLSVSVTSAACGGTFTLAGTPISLGGNYVSATTTFSGSGSNASTIQWTGGTGNTTGTLKITLGGPSGGTLTGALGTSSSYSPSASITDLAGNAMSTTAVTGSGRF